MKRLIALIIVLLFLISGISAETTEDLRDVFCVDNGFSERFNRTLSNLNQELLNFAEGDLKLDLFNFIKTDEAKEFRAAIGNYSVVAYGFSVADSPLAQLVSYMKMDYFSITTVISFESDEEFQKCIGEFLVLSYASILASNNSFTTRDADAVLFEKLDAKKLLSEQKNEFIIEHKGHKFYISSVKDIHLHTMGTIKLKLFPKLEP